MGKTARDVSGDEEMEEIRVKREKLLDAIQGRLTAGNNVVNTLLLYFPNESSEYLIKFWNDVADAVVKDYEDFCCGIFGNPQGGVNNGRC